MIKINKTIYHDERKEERNLNFLNISASVFYNIIVICVCITHLILFCVLFKGLVRIRKSSYISTHILRENKRRN